MANTYQNLSLSLILDAQGNIVSLRADCMITDGNGYMKGITVNVIPQSDLQSAISNLVTSLKVTQGVS